MRRAEVWRKERPLQSCKIPLRIWVVMSACVQRKASRADLGLVELDGQKCRPEGGIASCRLDSSISVAKTSSERVSSSGSTARACAVCQNGPPAREQIPHPILCSRVQDVFTGTQALTTHPRYTDAAGRPRADACEERSVREDGDRAASAHADLSFEDFDDTVSRGGGDAVPFPGCACQTSRQRRAFRWSCVLRW